MINLICQTNKCKNILYAIIGFVFFDKLTVVDLVQPDFQANLRK